LRTRVLLPGGLLAIAALGTLALVFPGVAQASTAKAQSVSASVKACGSVNLKGVSNVHNTGNPFDSSNLVCFDGVILHYGSSAITYTNPPRSYVAAGKLLFDTTCSSCHGTNANGVTPTGQAAIGPNLQGVGAATIDFWITTGRMPATDIAAVEAERKPPKLNDKQALEVAAYINSLDPAVPAVPTPHLKGANVSVGASLFSLNCAACHTHGRR
jgi:mono/diheme cytochrome c family protein